MQKPSEEEVFSQSTHPSNIFLIEKVHMNTQSEQMFSQPQQQLSQAVPGLSQISMNKSEIGKEGRKSWKEKSLGQICKRFLNTFGAKTEERVVNLEDCVQFMKIERRRIYDIVNILESFQTIRRK